MASFIGLTDFLALENSNKDVFGIAFGNLTHFASTIYLRFMLLADSLIGASGNLKLFSIGLFRFKAGTYSFIVCDSAAYSFVAYSSADLLTLEYWQWPG